MSILHDSLKEANKKIEEKDVVIEELKSQCEIVTSKIKQDWQNCYEDKLLEIQTLNVF